MKAHSVYGAGDPDELRAALDTVERDFLRAVGRDADAGRLSLERYSTLVEVLRRRTEEIISSAPWGASGDEWTSPLEEVGC